MSCVDIVCIKQKDGTAKCSPFFIKFTSINYRYDEKVVIKINDIDTNLRMEINGDTLRPYFTHPVTTENKNLLPYSWKEYIQESITSVPTYDSLLVDPEKFGKFLKENSITQEKNIISFQIGEEKLTSDLFIWDESDKLVIVDVDGTITKSDSWGYIYSFIGWDYSHEGVSSCFQKISENGYKIVYLTARTIADFSIVKQYLSHVEEKNGKGSMPSGALITSPNNIGMIIVREIMNSPESFKIELLFYLKSLFKEKDSLFGGFGNQSNDYTAYKTQINPNRIFIIKEEISISNLKYKGYVELSKDIEKFFPKIKKEILENSKNLELKE